MPMQEAFDRLEELDEEIVLVSHIKEVLNWDLEVVPPAGGGERARQQGWIERKVHDMVSSDEMGGLLAQLGASESQEEGDPSLDDRCRGLIRNRFIEWNRERKLDPDLVQIFTEKTAIAYRKWVVARQANDFSLFEPCLTELVSLVREKASQYGYTDDPYDALLQRFEPGMATREVSEVFSTLQTDLASLLDRLKGAVPVEDSFLYLKYPEDRQALFGKEILDAMGFDTQRGVTGISAHPYTTTLGSDDIRITTRYTEPNVSSALFSTIHEGGHALYEMGASNAHTASTNLANGASCAMHESQSRLWENVIGRSRPFWAHFYPRFKELFSQQLEGVDEKRFLAAINKVEPSCIRVNADEATYAMHIILRFNLERRLLSGDLKVANLPQAWNDGMADLLGIRPRTASEGVLQDVHWSYGEFGYFPTYALGNLYGAQIYQTMGKELDVNRLLQAGELAPIKAWLDAHVYQYGAIYKPKVLLERVTGRSLDASCFRDYLFKKYT